MKKLLVMPDFCSTGLWLAEDNLRNHESVDREDLCSENILITEELYKEFLDWIEDYDKAHDRIDYVFISESDWKRSFDKGLELAHKIKTITNIPVHFWMEGIKETEFIKKEIE